MSSRALLISNRRSLTQRQDRARQFERSVKFNRYKDNSYVSLYEMLRMGPRVESEAEPKLTAREVQSNPMWSQGFSTYRESKRSL